MEFRIDKTKLKECQAFFCDIDGTLIDSRNQLSLKTIEAVNKLPIPFFLISGRNYKGMKGFANQLGLKTPILSVNGNSFVQDGKLIYQGPQLDKSLAFEICSKLGNKYEDSISIEGLDPFKWYCNTLNNSYIQYEIGVLGFMPDIVLPSCDFLNHTPMSKLLVIAKKTDADDIMDLLQEYTDRCQVVRNHETYIELYAFDTSKGIGARKAGEMNGFDPEKCIACGDSGVDLALLQSVGIKACVSNADKELKDVADIITDSHDEDGVAKLIEEIIRQKEN